jgi:hypothetical protein
MVLQLFCYQALDFDLLLEGQACALDETVRKRGSALHRRQSASLGKSIRLYGSTLECKQPEQEIAMDAYQAPRETWLRIVSRFPFWFPDSELV